jgi:GNAT superfamily N-acetyltransferase
MDLRGAELRTPTVRYWAYAAEVAEYTVKPLRRDTWDAFAQLVERHNGVWGGCWCLSYHSKFSERGLSVEGNRALKQRLVSEGQAHASVVFDGDRAVGWCQYGTPEELPTISHRKEYEAGLVEHPDYRLTCFFVDRDYRRDGVSAVALRGALDLIARAGGGIVEGYPRDIQEEEKVAASFLYNGTRSLFEQAGFEYERPKGKNHCVMRTWIAPTRAFEGQTSTSKASSGRGTRSRSIDPTSRRA